MFEPLNLQTVQLYIAFVSDLSVDKESKKTIIPKKSSLITSNDNNYEILEQIATSYQDHSF